MTALQCRILRPIPGRVRFRKIPKQHCLFSYQTLEVCGTFIFKALFFSKSCDLLAVAVKSTLAGVHAVTRVLQGLIFTFVINILNWTSRERSSFHWVSIDPCSPEVRMFHLCKCTKNNICSIDLIEAPVLQKRLNGSFPVPNLKIRTKVFPAIHYFFDQQKKREMSVLHH